MKKTISLLICFLLIVGTIPSAIMANAESYTRYGVSEFNPSQVVLAASINGEYDDVTDTFSRKVYRLTAKNDVFGSEEISSELVYDCGDIDVPSNSEYFILESKGSRKFYRSYYSSYMVTNVYDIKTSTGKYLSVNNHGLVLSNENPGVCWRLSSNTLSQLNIVDPNYASDGASVNGFNYICIDPETSEFYSTYKSWGATTYNLDMAYIYSKTCSHKNMIHHEHTNATCNKNGSKEYYECPDCGNKYSDQIGNRIIYNYDEELVIAATGHNDENGDLICDNCSEKLTPYKFRKVTQASDIIAGGTYILVDENKNILGKSSYGQEISGEQIDSVLAEKDGSYYDFYKVKSAGALIFKLKHIFGYQEWGEDVSMCFGMHFDNIGLNCEGGYFRTEAAEYAKYGMKFGLNSDGSANVSSFYDQHWNDGESENILKFRSISTSSKEKGDDSTFFSMFPLAFYQSYTDASEAKVYLYRMVEAGALGDITYELSDTTSETNYTIGENTFGSENACLGTIVTGVADAIKDDALSNYITSAASSNEVTVHTKVNVTLTNMVEPDFENPGNATATFSLTPIISVGGKEAEIADKNFNGSKMEVTLYTGGIIPKQIIHIKNNGTKEYFYQEYSEEAENGSQTFSYEFDTEGNCFVTFMLTEYSDIILNETSQPEQTVKYGDINEDAKIDAKDVLLLRKYLSNWTVTVNKANADCNADGKIDAKDVLLLRKFLSGWSVTLGK